MIAKQDNQQVEKVLLIVLDGYGIGPDYEGNAITRAHTPTLDQLEKDYPHVLLQADSEAVGLPANTMGGSEVGHYTMGAGRAVLQSLPMINQKIATGAFDQNPALLQAIEHVKANNSCLHLVGMISDAGVHSHIDHLFALLELAQQHTVEKVYIHAITDGRDVPERSAQKYLTMIEQKCRELKTGQLTDIVGRFYAMDRDNNWQRTEEAFQLYTNKDSKSATAATPSQAVEDFYNNSTESDYYFKATKLEPITEGQITNKDSVIFFNYRTDRAKQLTDAFTLQEFPHFKHNLEPLPFFVCFGEYSQVAPVAFPPDKAEQNLGSYISELGLKQLRIAETEKYPHVTFFFNSQNKEPYPGEDRIVVPSPKVASYADQPEMSAHELTKKLCQELATQKYHLIVSNYANMDLVGHSGELEPTIKAVETVDQCLKEVIEIAHQNQYNIIITGDHGNADQMLYKDGSACPSHSMNPTQCIIAPLQNKNIKIKDGNSTLQNIASTVLDLMNIEKPPAITTPSLLKS